MSEEDLPDPNSVFSQEELEFATIKFSGLLWDFKKFWDNKDNVKVNGYGLHTYTAQMEYLRQHASEYPYLIRAMRLLGMPEKSTGAPSNREAGEVQSDAPPISARKLVYPKDLL